MQPSSPALSLTLRLATLSLVAPAALRGPAASVRIEYAPAAGTTWQRTFEVTTELVFDDLEVVMDGQVIDAQFLPQIDMDSRDTSHLQVTDELREVGQGRPGRIHRTYEAAWREAEQTMEMVGMMPDPIETFGEGSSPLQGRSVAFVWTAPGEDVERDWVDDDSDDALLSGLDADLDLLAWLPEGPLEQGDAWSLPAQLIEGLLAPGGDLGIELEGEGAEEFERGEDGESEFEGELTLRLVSVRDDDGERLAVIELSGDFEVELTYAGDLEHVPVADGTTTNRDRIEHELEGEILWDLGAGLLRSLEARSDVVIESHAVKDPGQEGPAFESTATLSGSMTFSVEVERVD